MESIPPKAYALAIMFPNNDQDTLATFTSNVPFGPISAGDLIYCEEERRKHAVQLLRAVCLEHQLYQGEGIGFQQTTRVYTEEVPATPATRLKR